MTREKRQLAGIAVTFILLIILSILSRRSQQITEPVQTQPKASAAVELRFNPSEATIPPNSTFPVDVILEYSEPTTLSSLSTEFSLDSDTSLYIQRFDINQELSQSAQWSFPFSQVSSDGKVSLTAVSKTIEGIPPGTYILGTVYLRSFSASTTITTASFTNNPNVTIFYPKIGTSIIPNTQTATFTVGTPTLTPSPTLSPTPTPTSPTLTPSPTPTQDSGINPISWITSDVLLTADDFYLIADGQTFTAPIGTTFRVESDPTSYPEDPYTTLEVHWNEAGHEMRFFIYFRHNGVNWQAFEARTYNGKIPSDWIYYTQRMPDFTTPLTFTYGPTDKTLQSDEISSTNPFTGNVYFKNLRLQAFRKYTIPSPTPTPIPKVDLTLRFRLMGVVQPDMQSITEIHFKPTVGETVFFSNPTAVSRGAQSDYYHEAVLRDIPYGTYRVCIKAKSHLRGCVNNLTVNASTTELTVNLPNGLLSGDINGDNKLTQEDAMRLNSAYTTYKTPADSVPTYDIDNDGFITVMDLALFALNYDIFVRLGEEL